MENILLNKSNSGYGKRLAVLLTVVASLALSTTAWARDDFNDWMFNTDKGWAPWTTIGGTAPYGFTKTFTLYEIEVSATWDEYWVDGVNFVYYLNGKDQEHYVGAYWVGSSCLSGCTGMDVKTGNLNTNLVNDSRIHNPGQNTLHLKFEAKRNNQVVKDNWGYVNFTLPGWNITTPSNGVIDFGTKTIGDAKEEWTTKFNSYGWEYATLTIEGDGFSFVNPTTHADLGKKISNFKINNDYGEATVCFDPTKQKVGTYQATLKFHGEFDGSTYEKTVTIKAKLDPQAPTTVTIGEPAVVGVGPSAVLSGYLKKAGCDRSLTEYGFYVYNGGSCASQLSKITAKGTALSIGDTWKNTVSAGLQPNTAYSYKPYVKSDNANKETKSSACYTFTTGSDVCKFAPADTIYYTIDSSIEHDDPCALVFQSIENALVNLKSHSTNGADDYWWDSNSSMLRNNVVFQLVKNKAGYGVVNERVSLTNINKYDNNATAPTYEFVMRSADISNKALVYGLNLAGSRKVTLKNLLIRRDSPSTSDGKGHACILLGFDSEENALEVGKMKDAGLRFINCQISGDNFCCIHANGIDGLYMEDCNLIANCSQVSEDTYNWGGSIKMMNCKNVTLLRNNFKGQHSNNIFAQNVQNMLVMNNVFWNDNLSVSKTGWGTSNTLAVIRLINFGANDSGHIIKNVGMYYNTLYLADNGTSAESNKLANFLTLGGVAKNQQTKDKTMYDFNTIDFMHNNCYSYDGSLTGKTTDAFCSKDISTSTHITNNNFWDANNSSKDPSDFAFGNVKRHVDMSLTGGMVCSNAPFTPEGLVIKGTGLNWGSKISSDVSGLGADKITSDRKFLNIRPSDSGWTLGAYQNASPGDPIETIVWEGSANNEWDNRNNWRTLDGSLITCVDVLSTDLKVIIPELDSLVTKKPEDTRYYPVIPGWDDESTIPADERVRAGVGGGKGDATKFASNIDLQYGASLLGVENLYPNESGTKHYDNATSHLTIGKEEWVLVGSVIAGTVSGNYYKNFEPHVYMQQFDATSSGSGITVNWGIPFTDLYQGVGINQSFAILARDQYGQKEMFPADLYYKVIKPDPEKVDNGKKPETFDLTGSFAYDAAPPSIQLKAGVNVLNNAYPAVLKPTAFDGYTVYVYDYDNCCWSPINSSAVPDDDKYVKPQSGFIVKTTESGTLSFDQGDFDMTKDARYRLRSAIDNSVVVLKAYNTATGKGSSIAIGSDEIDASKIFNGSVTDNAELYIMNNGGPLSTQLLSEEYRVIPLGIRNKGSKSMDVKFELTKVEGLDNVILEDRSVSPAVKYNLLEGALPCFLSLPVGDIENRFFLVIGEEEEDIPTEADDDVTTGSTSIDIYSDGNTIVIASSDEVILKSAEITDMSGRTTVVTLKDAHYNKIKGNGVQQGVYIVKAIGDTKTETAKVIVK